MPCSELAPRSFYVVVGAVGSSDREVACAISWRSQRMEAGTVARLDGQRTPAKMSYLQQGPFGTTRARLPRRSCSSQGRARTGRSPRHVSASMLAPSKSRIPAEFLSPALHTAAEG